jgi:hypothetical protein
MKVLAYGEIMDGGLSVFHVVAGRDDDDRLVVTFEGVIRVDNPYRYLHTVIEELSRVLPRHSFASILMDFTRMRFSNDNAWYVIMDIIDAVYNLVPGPVTVRIADDDWQGETVPILLNLSEADNAARTTFEDIKAP